MKEYQDLKHVTLKTYKFGVRLDQRELPFDKSLDEGDTFELHYGAEIPWIAPPGDYDLQFEVKNIDEHVVQCWGMKLHI